MTDNNPVRLSSEAREEWLNVPLPQRLPAPSLLADEELQSFLSSQSDATSESFWANNDGEAATIHSVPISLETERRVDQTLETHDGNRRSCSTRSSREEERPAVTPRPLTHVWKAWLFEILSLVAGVSSLIAIATVLGMYNDQRQPQWPYSVNLTTLVALLATILRSMLMQVIESVEMVLVSLSAAPVPYEYFGRSDPWSVGLTKTLSLDPKITIESDDNVLDRNWATFAAGITTVSVGIGAFTQQSLQTFPCSRPVPGNNTLVPIARTVNSGYVIMATATQAAGSRLLDPGMKSALMMGLGGTKSSVPISCPTGNCTFEDVDGITYSTLGFNSQCFDATPLLIQTGLSSWSRGEFTEPSQSGWTNYSLHIPDNQDDFSLGYSLVTYPTDSYWGRWEPIVSVARSPPPLADLPSTAPREWKYLQNSTFFTRSFLVPISNPCQQETLSLFDQYNRSDNDLDPPIDPSVCPQLSFNNLTSLPGNWSVTATTCYFYPSLRNYHGSIENGRLQERMVGDPVPLTYNTISGNVSYYGFQDPCIIDGKWYTKSNFSSAPGKTFYSGADTGPQQCAYWLPDQWYNALHTTLGVQIDSPTQDDCYFTSDYTDVACADKWWLTRMYNNRNASVESISQVMDDVAESLTTQLRTIGTDIDGKPSFAYGTAYQTEVCTRFVWQWLFFPGAVTLATAFALLAVTVSSGSEGMSIMSWKTSVLPLLFYGWSRDGGTGKVNDGLLSEEELSRLAKTSKVEFSRKEDGWSFHAAK